MPLMSMQLEQSLMARDKRELNVSEIIVEVSSCVLLVQQQRQLFDENPRLDRQSLAHLINRLSSRLGAQNVVYPTFRSGAQPELSFQFRALVDPNRKRRRTQAVPTSHVLGRPLRLLTPPVAVSVKRETVPNSEDCALVFRKPAQITFENGVNRGTQKIARSWGPERIEPGWWRGATVQRDYWSIVTEAGTQFWVFCDLNDGKWFVHGEF
jgi:protein ImuB